MINKKIYGYVAGATCVAVAILNFIRHGFYLGSIVDAVAFLLIAVGLFLQQDKLVLGGAVARVLYLLYNFVSYFFIDGVPVSLFWISMDLIPLLVGICVLIAAYKSKMAKTMAIAVFLIYIVSMFLSIFGIVYFEFLPFIALYSCCWALQEETAFKAVRPKTAAVAGNSTISTAEKLTNLKELLDSGIITQEEFDAKKKELLNL